MSSFWQTLIAGAAVAFVAGGLTLLGAWFQARRDAARYERERRDRMESERRAECKSAARRVWAAVMKCRMCQDRLPAQEAAKAEASAPLVGDFQAAVSELVASFQMEALILAGDQGTTDSVMGLVAEFGWAASLYGDDVRVSALAKVRVEEYGDPWVRVAQHSTTVLQSLRKFAGLTEMEQALGELH